MMFLGIDNGLSGGMILLNNNQDILWKIVMPTIKIKGKSEYDVGKIVETLTFVEPYKIRCCLEKSHVRPISGKRACFMTGYGYGLIQGILESKRISYEIVKPQIWMKELEIDSKDTKGSIPFCQRKWPDEQWTATERSKKPHDGLTDAGAIAIYCYRLNRSQTE